MDDRDEPGAAWIATGQRGRYHWLETVERPQWGLVQACPSVFIGKYAVITSFDSGPYVPSDEELAAGWRVEGDLAFCPRIEADTDLPADQYDEWLLFDRPTSAAEIGPVEVFVNYSLFSLSGRPWDDAEQAKHGQMRAEQFWTWLERSGLEAYVADGDMFVFATRNPGGLAEVTAWLAEGTREGD